MWFPRWSDHFFNYSCACHCAPVNSRVMQQSLTQPSDTAPTVCGRTCCWARCSSNPQPRESSTAAVPAQRSLAAISRTAAVHYQVEHHPSQASQFTLPSFPRLHGMTENTTFFTVRKAVVSWHLGTTISPMKTGKRILFQSIQTVTNENQSNKSNANQAVCQMFWVYYNVALQYKKYSQVFELHTFSGFFKIFYFIIIDR